MSLIVVGSQNKVKVKAVEEVLHEYPLFAACQVKAVAVSSDISEQPLSLEEIITGAKNRARHAYQSVEACLFSLGLESGLFKAPGTRSGYLESSICCIYDGINYYTGLSCGFEVPQGILALVLEQNMDLGQACYHSGITKNAQLGSAEGLVGMVTSGRVDRKEYTKQGVRTALAQLENAHLYDKH